MRSKSPQAKLDLYGKSPDLRFGGELLVGKRKSERVLVSRHPVHLVMRSPMARGARSMLRKVKAIENIVRTQAKKQHIQISDFVNVGNHLHMVIKIYARGSERNLSFARFMRATSGLIARTVLGAERGAGKLKSTEQFWPTRPYTRVLSRAKADYQNLHHYLTLNVLEATGFDRSAWELLRQNAPPLAS